MKYSNCAMEQRISHSHAIIDSNFKTYLIILNTNPKLCFSDFIEAIVYPRVSKRLCCKSNSLRSAVPNIKKIIISFRNAAWCYSKYNSFL